MMARGCNQAPFFRRRDEDGHASQPVHEVSSKPYYQLPIADHGFYSGGVAEEILGTALRGRRNNVIISTEGNFHVGARPDAVGSPRYALLNDGSLRRQDLHRS